MHHAIPDDSGSVKISRVTETGLTQWATGGTVGSKEVIMIKTNNARCDHGLVSYCDIHGHTVAMNEWARSLSDQELAGNLRYMSDGRGIAHTEKDAILREAARRIESDS